MVEITVKLAFQGVTIITTDPTCDREQNAWHLKSCDNLQNLPHFVVLPGNGAGLGLSKRSQFPGNKAIQDP